MTENQNSEQKARDTIDAMLRQAGWVVQSVGKLNLSARVWQAEREYQTKSPRMSEVDQLKQTLVTSLRQAEALQSILKRPSPASWCHKTRVTNPHQSCWCASRRSMNKLR